MKPIRTDSRSAVLITAGIFSLWSFPMSAAINTLTPTASPEDVVTISAMISVLVPTAAKAFASPKYPTTAVSAALNNCWRMLLRAMGRVNSNRFLVRGPCSMSIFADFKFMSILISSYCSDPRSGGRVTAELHPGRRRNSIISKWLYNTFCRVLLQYCILKTKM